MSYSFSEIQFFDFLNAFNGVSNDFLVKILRPNEEVTYQFDIDNVKNILSDYLYSKNTSSRNCLYDNIITDCVYGIEIYEHLKLYFESFLDKKITSDIRLLHILWEHKKCMLARIKYLYEKKYLISYDSFIITIVI